MRTLYTDVPLKERNSFGVEATAARLIEYDDPAELGEIFSHDLAPGDRWMVISGGNNILFTQDYDGTLLHPISKGISIVQDDGTKYTIRVEAGEEWDDVVAWAVDNGLWGIENLSHIPGYAGAAPVQNIGAYGVELNSVVDSVEVFLLDGLGYTNFTAEECRFGYRDSIFKRELKGRAIITALYLRLSRTPSPNIRYGQLNEKLRALGRPSLENIRKAVIDIRKKLPDPATKGNAGSFFKNPIVNDDRLPRLEDLFPKMPVYPSGRRGFSKLAAGWLIEFAGWKGFDCGNVGVHPDQALVLVNHGGATGAEVVRLARLIQSDIASRFAIKLEAEVNIV